MQIKNYFYKNTPENGWNLYSVTINKDKVWQKLRTPIGQKKLYNFIARYVIVNVELDNDVDNVTLVVDKSKNSSEMKDFDEYITNQLSSYLPLETNLNIYHESSNDNAGLQAVDLFCWGIQRSYEREDFAWYNIFESNVRFNKLYWK